MVPLNFGADEVVEFCQFENIVEFSESGAMMSHSGRWPALICPWIVRLSMSIVGSPEGVHQLALLPHHPTLSWPFVATSRSGPAHFAGALVGDEWPLVGVVVARGDALDGCEVEAVVVVVVVEKEHADNAKDARRAALPVFFICGLLDR